MWRGFSQGGSMQIGGSGNVGLVVGAQMCQKADQICKYAMSKAVVVELVYTADLKSAAVRLAGSSPAVRTNHKFST